MDVQWKVNIKVFGISGKFGNILRVSSYILYEYENLKGKVSFLKNWKIPTLGILPHPESCKKILWNLPHPPITNGKNFFAFLDVLDHLEA